MEPLKIKCEYTELVRVSQLVENPKNANKHTKEQIDRLAKILDFQGWRHPIIVSKRSGFICAGHGRLLAAKQLEQETVPVDYQDFLTEAEEYAFLVADNEIARWATLDKEKLQDDLKDLDLGDIDLLGIQDFTFDLPQDDFDPEIEDEEKEEKHCPHCNGVL